MNKVETDDLYPLSIQPSSVKGDWKVYDYSHDSTTVLAEGSYGDCKVFVNEYKRMNKHSFN